MTNRPATQPQLMTLPRRIFVTATDTDAGKTTFARLLVQTWVDAGRTVAVFKPVAAGGTWVNTKPGALKALAQQPDIADKSGRPTTFFINDDAWALLHAANSAQSYQEVNPLLFKHAIAPHIAAAQEQRALSVAHIQHCCSVPGPATRTYCVVEGLGGWQVPLNETETMADWVIAEKLPVVLVVAMRLGCLNHALLSAESICNRGAQLVGWVANIVEPQMPALEANLATLDKWLSAPRIGMMSRNTAGSLVLT